MIKMKKVVDNGDLVLTLGPEQLLSIAGVVGPYLDHFDITNIYADDKVAKVIIKPKKYVDKKQVFDDILNDAERNLPFLFVRKVASEEDEYLHRYEFHGDELDQLVYIDGILFRYGFKKIPEQEIFNISPNNIGDRRVILDMVKEPLRAYEIGLVDALNEIERSGSFDYETLENAVKLSDMN